MYLRAYWCFIIIILQTYLVFIVCFVHMSHQFFPGANHGCLEGWRGHLHRTTSSVLVAVQRLSQPLPPGCMSWVDELALTKRWRRKEEVKAHILLFFFVLINPDFVF